MHGALRPRRATVLALAAGVALIGITAPPALAVSDTTTAGGAQITFHPFTMPTNSGCVFWPADGSYNCDPVNVIFPGRSPGQVRDLLRARGWTTFDLGSSQRLHFASSTLYAQDVQVFRPDGRNPAGQSLRYHVRLWLVRGAATTVTVGAVHHEARQGFSDIIDRSWEASEAFVVGQLCAPGACPENGALPTQLAMQGGGTTWRRWTNDAQPSVIP